MVRSAAALLAVFILSGFAAIQQVATHTVVRGDTLWDLAEHYYANPFDWRRIWEANRDKIRDPNLIYPDQVFTIPGRQAEVSGVEVEAPAGAVPPEAPSGAATDTAAPSEAMRAAPAPTPRPADAPTIFRTDTAGQRARIARGFEERRVAVPRTEVLAAPWLVRLGAVPDRLGRIDGFAGSDSPSKAARRYDRVRIAFEGAAPPVGTQLQVFHPAKLIEMVGQVMQPTGLVTVVELAGEQAAVGVVSGEVDRMTVGDLVRTLPEYDVSPGQTPEPVSGGGEAMVMGFAGLNAVQSIGSIAFLDQGSDDGVNVGDEYEYANPDAGSDAVEGRLQVVCTTPGIASARIVSMDDAVFHQGIVVRLSRKMR